jgi:hypothetical protein
MKVDSDEFQRIRRSLGGGAENVAEPLPPIP